MTIPACNELISRHETLRKQIQKAQLAAPPGGAASPQLPPIPPLRMSQSSIAGLTCINVAELLPDHRHIEAYMLLRTLVAPLKLVALYTVVEDLAGFTAKLALHNFFSTPDATPPQIADASCHLPAGTVLCVKEPCVSYASRNSGGGGVGALAIHVHSPCDVLVLCRGDSQTPNEEVLRLLRQPLWQAGGALAGGGDVAVTPPPTPQQQLPAVHCPGAVAAAARGGSSAKASDPSGNIATTARCNSPSSETGTSFSGTVQISTTASPSALQISTAAAPSPSSATVPPPAAHVAAAAALKTQGTTHYLGKHWWEALHCYREALAALKAGSKPHLELDRRHAVDATSPQTCAGSGPTVPAVSPACPATSAGGTVMPSVELASSAGAAAVDSFCHLATSAGGTAVDTSCGLVTSAGGTAEVALQVTLHNSCAATCLMVEDWHGAVQHAVAALRLDPCSTQAVQYRVKALTQLQRYAEARVVLEDLLNGGAHHPNAAVASAAVLKRAKLDAVRLTRLVFEQATGEYDMLQVYEEAATLTSLDHAEFIGPVEVVDLGAQRGGRALRVTRDVVAGELLLAVKADALVPSDELEAYLMHSLLSGGRLADRLSYLYAGPRFAVPPAPCPTMLQPWLTPLVAAPAAPSAPAAATSPHAGPSAPSAPATTSPRAALSAPSAATSPCADPSSQHLTENGHHDAPSNGTCASRSAAPNVGTETSTRCGARCGTSCGMSCGTSQGTPGAASCAITSSTSIPANGLSETCSQPDNLGCNSSDSATALATAAAPATAAASAPTTTVAAATAAAAAAAATAASPAEAAEAEGAESEASEAEAAAASPASRFCAASTLGEWGVLRATADKGFVAVDEERVLGIINLNAFEPESLPNILVDANSPPRTLQGGGGIWWLPAFINHACAGNANRWCLGDFMFVRCIRNLKAGEQVTFSYCDPLVPLESRHEALHKHGFMCQCAMCEEERSTLQRSPLEELAKRAKALAAWQELVPRLQAVPRLPRQQLARLAQRATPLAAALMALSAGRRYKTDAFQACTAMAKIHQCTQDHKQAVTCLTDAYAALQCSAADGSSSYFISELCCLVCLNILMELAAGGGGGGSTATTSSATAAVTASAATSATASQRCGAGCAAQPAAALPLAESATAVWLERARSCFAVFLCPDDALFRRHFRNELNAARLGD